MTPSQISQELSTFHFMLADYFRFRQTGDRDVGMDRLAHAVGTLGFLIGEMTMPGSTDQCDKLQSNVETLTEVMASANRHIDTLKRDRDELQQRGSEVMLNFITTCNEKKRAELELRDLVEAAIAHGDSEWMSNWRDNPDFFSAKFKRLCDLLVRHEARFQKAKETA